MSESSWNIIIECYRLKEQKGFIIGFSDLMRESIVKLLEMHSLSNRWNKEQGFSDGVAHKWLIN